MATPRTPPGSFQDLSDTIRTDGATNNRTENTSTGAVTKNITTRIERNQSGSGDTGASTFLHPHETMQILQENQKRTLDEAVGRMSHAMTSKICEMEERTRREFALWKRNFENEVLDMMRQLTIERIAPAQIPNGDERQAAQPPQSPTRSPEHHLHGMRLNQIPVEDEARPEYPRYGRESKTTPVHKWGINFSADENKVTVEEFIFQLEHLQFQNETPWKIVMGEFHKLLSGKATEWYWRYLKLNGVPNWPTLREALKRQYQNTFSDFEITRKLVERKQGQGEGIDEYLQEMSKLRSRLSRTFPEEEMIKIVKSNIQENIRKVLYPMQIYSLQQLRLEYHNIHSDFNFQKPKEFPQQQGTRQNTRNYNHEITYSPQEDWWNYHDSRQQVEELKPRMPLKCWNCQEVGHTYIECIKPRNIFCYKCGKPKVVTPHCSRCRPLNCRPGPAAASGLDSEKQQAGN